MAIRLQNATLNALTDLLRDLANYLLTILKTRWFAVLAGTALDLGTAGAEKVIAVVLGAGSLPTI